jgi:hypothetical protein
VHFHFPRPVLLLSGDAKIPYRVTRRTLLSLSHSFRHLVGGSSIFGD